MIEDIPYKTRSSSSLRLMSFTRHSYDESLTGIRLMKNDTIKLSKNGEKPNTLSGTSIVGSNN